MAPARSEVVALDVGGTKLAAGIVRSDGTIVERAQVPTPARGTSEDLWAAVVGLLDPLAERSTGPVGVGTGGPMTRGGRTVSPLNIPAWRDEPVLERLVDRYRRPVAIDNDAKALALGEGRWGAARGCDDYIAMVVSTGVGGGIVSGGRLLDGQDGNAGHIGHVIVEPDGRECVCGGRGCLEAEVSGPSIAARTGGDPRNAPIDERRRAGLLVGRAVASVAALLDLRLALVSGSVALGFGDDFFDAAQAELDRSARISFVRGARIGPGGLGADGPLLGAGAVAFASVGWPSRPQAGYSPPGHSPGEVTRG